jgi:hypothetical protein
MKVRILVALLLAFVLPLASTSARATLLFAGGEDSDFICATSGTCAVDTNAQSHRAVWSRESYYVYGSSGDAPINRFGTGPFTASQSLWVHGQYCSYYNTSCYISTSSAFQWIRLIDTAGYATLVVRGTGNNGQVTISSRSTGGTFTTLVTCNGAVASALTQMDMFVDYDTSGEVALYTNGVRICDYTGNVTNGDGATALNSTEFGAVTSTNFTYGAWSEVIVATTDTRGMSRFSAYTVGNGNTTGFSGTNVCSSIWAATAFKDTSYGYTDTSNVSHECTIHGSLPAGSYDVVGLVMSARAQVGATGPQHFDFLTRVGGTDYASPDFVPILAFSNINNYVQETNPATTSAWSVSDFAAAGFNVGEESTP